MNKNQQHARTASQGRKLLPPHARPTKPAPLKRGATYNNVQPSPKSPSSIKANWRKSLGAEEDVQPHIEEEEVGMASFLQFCTTCERQIVTPGAVLYCSEACRRKDVSRPTSIQSIESVASPSIVRNTSSYFDYPQADIVPQRSPTVIRPLSRTFSDLSISDSNSSSDGSSDNSRQDGDSMRYLEQFYSGFAAADQGNARSGRPHMNRSSMTTDSSNIPSLVHSPSSSYGTIASNASYRPLASRHHPWNCNCSTSKSIDLVIPFPTQSSSPTQLLKDASLKSGASTETSFRVVEAGNISRDKDRTPIGSRRGSERRVSADRTLKQLYSHDAVKASPKYGDIVERLSNGVFKSRTKVHGTQ